MKKVFVSMPMMEKTYRTINSIQNAILTAIEEHPEVSDELQVIETYPLYKEYVNGNLSGIEHICERLKLLSKADYIAFWEGWENVQRCHLEHAYAEIFSIPCFYLEEDKEEDVQRKYHSGLCSHLWR